MTHIDSYSFGLMIVDGKTYSSDLIIFPGKIIPNWRRKSGHSLCVEDIEEVFSYKPEIVVIGKGADCCMEVPSELKKIFAGKHIKLIAENTQKASELFNEYVSRGEKVAGLFHLTC